MDVHQPKAARRGVLMQSFAELAACLRHDPRRIHLQSLMPHRIPSLSSAAPVFAAKRWLSVLAIPLLAGCTSVAAQELVRAPGWLAVVPSGGQPTIPEVRAKGREWFVDASRGDDFAEGSKKQPWKTLGKVKRAGVGAGDVVRLKCGGIWREALDIEARTLPAGVVLAAEAGCGAGQAPSIRGSDVVGTSWDNDDAAAGDFSVDRFGAVNGIAYKGKRAIQARFPDYGGPGKEFALADGLKTPRSFRLRDKERRVIGDRELVGANVYVRFYPWQIGKATVSAYDASTGVVTLDKDLPTPILNGAGYILEGKKWMLSAPGEWWQDAKAKRLHLISPDGQRPQPGDVEVVVRDHALRIRGASQLRVVGLDLRQTSKSALELHDANDTLIDGLSISDPGEFGALIYRSSRVAFRGARIERSGFNAVVTRDAPDAVVSGNLILDHGLAGYPGGNAAAIVVKGERTVVSSNQVIRSAAPGIHFVNLEGTQIVNNQVIRPCIRLTDCGGIQTWTSDSPEQATKRLLVRSVIKDNVILGTGSNLEGSSGRGGNQSNGIYFDSMTGGVQAVDNVIAGTENGFYIHNSQFNTVTGNLVRSVTHASITAHMSIPGADAIRGNRVKGNRLFSRPLSSEGNEVFAFKWQQPQDPDNLFAGGDANEVGDNQVLKAGSEGQTRWYVGEHHTARVMPQDGWRKFAKNEREQAISLPTDAARKQGKEGANVLPDGDFKAIASNWQAYFNPAGRGGAVSAADCGGTPCLKLVTGHPTDALSSKPFKLQADSGQNDHVLRVTLKGGPKGGSVRLSVRRDGPPYDNFGLDQPAMRLDPGQVLRVELPFQATSADAARMYVNLEQGAEVYLSRASLTHVDAPTSSPVTAARSLFVINLSGKAQSVSCADTKLADCSSLDEQGKDVKWPLSLPAGQGVTLFPRKPGT